MRIANERGQELVDSLIFRVHNGDRSGLVRSDVVISRKSEEHEIMHRWPISARRNMEDHGDIISTNNGGITDNEFSFYFRDQTYVTPSLDNEDGTS